MEPVKINRFNAVVTFILFPRIKQILAVIYVICYYYSLKTLKDIFIIKEGDNLSFRTGNKNTYDISQHSYEVKFQPKISKGKDFKIAIPIDNFLKPPMMEFNLAIKHKEVNGSDDYRICFGNEIFRFVLAQKL